MQKWAIVGGGVQGCTFAVHLIRYKQASADQISIIDPGEKPLSVWKRCTSIVDMPYLRSPSVHHIDVEPFALERFAKSFSWLSQNFYFPYDRPALDLFNRHCDHTLAELHIDQSYVRGRAADIQKRSKGWTVTLEDGRQIDAERVALAHGLSEAPFWPDWAAAARLNQGCIHHIFAHNPPDMAKLQTGIVIVGGGISASHLAIRLSSMYPGQVTLIMRHPIRVHQFDSDPGWLGPKLMGPYSEVRDYGQRRAMIVEARHRGSMPSELRTRLLRAGPEKGLTFIQDEIKTAVSLESGKIKLMTAGERELEAGTVLLATGFQREMPGRKWLSSAIENYSLPLSACGFPLVSRASLEWAPGLHTVGALAELEIGPVSRNIAGAQRASDRIIKAVSSL